MILQYLGDLGCEHIIIKNDEKTVDEIREMQPRGILVSPGPGDILDADDQIHSCLGLGSQGPFPFIPMLSHASMTAADA